MPLFMRHGAIEPSLENLADRGNRVIPAVGSHYYRLWWGCCCAQRNRGKAYCNNACDDDDNQRGMKRIVRVSLRTRHEYAALGALPSSRIKCLIDPVERGLGHGCVPPLGKQHQCDAFIAKTQCPLKATRRGT